MKSKFERGACLAILMIALFAIVPFSVMAEDNTSKNADNISTQEISVNIEFSNNYQDGFMVNSLTAVRAGDRVIFTLDYFSSRDCDYSFFNPPNGDAIMKRVNNGIKTGSNVTTLELSLYDLKKVMTDDSITMLFGFDDQNSYINFNTEQLSILTEPGELENLPEEVFDGSVEFSSDYQDGFQVNSLTAKRMGDKVVFTLNYASNRVCDYCFFNPPNGDVIKKIVNDGIKTGTNTTELTLNLYDLKRIMANDSITMRFGFDDQPSWIFFKTAQLASLASPGELENLPEEVFDGNVEFSGKYQEGFKADSLTAKRMGDKVVFTLDYISNRNCDYSFFNPPNGNTIMKIINNGIKTGTNTTVLELSLYDLKKIMANETITMRFGFDDQPSWIYFKTAQLASLASPGELENLPEEVFDGNIEYNGNYQDGFQADSLSAKRIGDKVVFTLNYVSNRNCDYSFFNPPNGTAIMKIVDNGIKTGTNTTELELSLYDLKQVMTADSITMKFGFNGKSSWINFKTAQLTSLASPGELENLPDESFALESIAISSPATKLSYQIGENLDISGLIVTGTYSDGTSKTEDICEENIKGFDSSQAAVNQILTITVNGKTATYTVQISGSDEPSEAGLKAFLLKASDGNFYEYDSAQINYSFVTYQMNPDLQAAKMYKHFADIFSKGGKVIGLKDGLKGYMDYDAAGKAFMAAQMKGNSFNMDSYLAGDSAIKLGEMVQNVKVVDKNGTINTGLGYKTAFYSLITPGRKMISVTLEASDSINYTVSYNGIELSYDPDLDCFIAEIPIDTDETLQPLITKN
jgi:hypothetical protein